jgi:hypothetical protein
VSEDLAHEGLVRHVAEEYEGRVVEIGVGERTTVAERLAREPHFDVIATDVSGTEIAGDGPAGPRFVRDDVTDPDIDVYREAALLYAIRAPPELHRPIADLAAAVDADAIVVPFGNDTVTVPHRLTSVDGTPLYRLDTSGR